MNIGGSVKVAIHPLRKLSRKFRREIADTVSDPANVIRTTISGRVTPDWGHANIDPLCASGFFSLPASWWPS